MNLSSFISALAVAALAAGPAAADLTKIDRTIPKEPAYQGKPQYCLLVFGPDARTHVWLVLDGEVLYVDRNGNGDLTEKGEQVALIKVNNLYAVDDITEPDRRAKHTALLVMPQKGGGVAVSIMTEGKHRQRSGPLTFAGRSQDAPIVHFNGPVSVRFASAVPLPGDRRQPKAVSLGAVMGTPGVGEGTFATYKARDILGGPDERVIVEAAFPNQDDKAKPIPVRGALQPDS